MVVIRGFSRQVCLVVPLTTSPKKNKYHLKLGKVIGDKSSSAIISQLKLIDTKRLVQKSGMLEKEKFAELKNAIKDLL